jgi:hypothetical protein
MRKMIHWICLALFWTGVHGGYYIQFNASAELPGPAARWPAIFSAIGYSIAPAEAVLLSADDIVVSVGDTGTLRALGGVGHGDRVEKGHENGFGRSGKDGDADLWASPDAYTLACYFGGRVLTVTGGSSRGRAYGVYAQLQRHFGAHFLHPLQSTAPPAGESSGIACGVRPGRVNDSRTDAPARTVRGVHYHTQHPLEFTELLNGFDSPDASWEAMFDNEYAALLEWVLAHGGERLEWLLLAADAWKDFVWSDLRRQRMQALVLRAHEFGLAAGVDVGVALVQQHMWPLVQNSSSPEDPVEAQIRRHLAWLLDSPGGFDYVSTESGFTEFTKPTCTEMLLWINLTTTIAADEFGKPTWIKCHCSTEQVCPDYPDPRTGSPINFNFLPVFADPRLGLYPHTVQMYTFDDPAPTYGNSNFTYMREFLEWQAPLRSTVYYGEDAYWVTFDSSVPLFLPVYGEARWHDLQQIQAAPVAGSVTFESGFEWAYWLQAISSLRAAWAPAGSDPSYESFLMNQTPVCTAFGRQAQDAVCAWLAQYSALQHRLLVLGGRESPLTDDAEVVMLNGAAYLSGWDTWDEISEMVQSSAVTQPVRLGIEDVRIPGHLPDYKSQVQPLLQAMAANFSAATAVLAALRPLVVAETLPFFDEIVDGANITAQRAAEILALYNYASSWFDGSESYRKQQVLEASAAIEAASEIVQRRQAAYRVPLDRIAGWRANPTSYRFGYVWTVKSLYFFWRDFGRALMVDVEAALSPCFLNIEDPLQVIGVEGSIYQLDILLYRWMEKYSDLASSVADCLSPPESEPVYPRDLMK